jgi:cytochrome c553
MVHTSWDILLRRRDYVKLFSDRNQLFVGRNEMKSVKLSLIALVAALAFSCSQTPPTPTTTSVLNSSNVVSVAVSSTPRESDRQIRIMNSKKGQPSLEAAAVAESDTDDVYAANCAICHKDTGKGGKISIKGKTLNAEDLTSEKMKKYSDTELAKDITDGVPDEGMPAFKDKLSSEEIAAVVAQVRALQSK